ncbi:hypothetical protein [Flavobacterium sp. SLB02]|uniref:hypothetical protein n=1 Tax=Flavobacterium sp. SLB02 TaxID=2665645 RepID=UPI0012A91BEA|nr:hypothetical protein [Flavobacterium sp. SLB02]QGK74422.1 hypothetical protein GIY83_10255 [Flavobacterium sp. SLB02]
MEIALKGQKKIEHKEAKKKVFSRRTSCKVNVLFEIRLPPFQGLKLQSFFIRSASHHAIAEALSEQQVSQIYNLQSVPVPILK